MSSTIGFEIEHQALLGVADPEEFVERTTAALAAQPPNFRNIVALNRGPLVKEVVDAHPVNPRQVELARDDGALVVDVRTGLQFDEAHIPGAVSITARRAGFGSKLAWLPRSDQPLVLVGCDDHDALEAAALAAAVGLRNIAGYLAGGMTSWREDGLPAERVARMTVGQLHDAWSGGAGLQVLDVRDPGACASGHIPGSVHATYHDIRELPAGIDPSRPVAVICASGERAAVAASLLKRYGAEDAIHVVDGGVPLWRRQGWPIEAPAGTPT